MHMHIILSPVIVIMSIKYLKVNEQRALSGFEFKSLFDAALNKIPSKKGKLISFECIFSFFCRGTGKV